jgi:hypothetical protein
MEQINQEINAPHSSSLVLDWIKTQSSQPIIQSEKELLRNSLQSIKTDPNYKKIREIVLPYTRLKSRFSSQDSLKLAEIDSLYQVCPRSPLSPYFPSLLAYTSSILVNSIDIGGGPEAYTEYYQFRYVNSMTMGFSSRETGWNLKRLDPHRLIRFYGQDQTGDLMHCWKEFLFAAQQQFVTGVDFISAASPCLIHYDFYELLQLYLIIKNIKDGASAVLRIEATWTDFMKQVLYFATQCFDNVILFQPLVSGSDSNEFFLVLKHAKTSRQNYYIVLQNLFKNIPQNLNTVYGFIPSILPDSFEKQIEQIKNEFYDLQAQKLLIIQEYLKDSIAPKRQNVDIKLKLLEWSLPDPY